MRAGDLRRTSLVLTLACSGRSTGPSTAPQESAPPSGIEDAEYLQTERSAGHRPSDAVRRSGEAALESCAIEDFEACTDACRTRACLEWCGGSSCAILASKLYGCAQRGLQEFHAANPEPNQEAPSPEAQQRHAAWEEAKWDATLEHWEDACEGSCVEAFDDSASTSERCMEIGDGAYGWPRELVTPDTALARAEPEDAAAGTMATEGVLSALSSSAEYLRSGGGVSLSVDPPADLKHGPALADLIARSDLAGVSACTPGLDARGKSIRLSLTFDARGRARVDPPGEDEGGELRCIRDFIEAHVSIPQRAARGLPPLTADLRLAPKRTAISGDPGAFPVEMPVYPGRAQGPPPGGLSSPKKLRSTTLPGGHGAGRGARGYGD